MQAEQKEALERVLSAIERVCERERCAEAMLRDLMQVAGKQEREHRAAGMRFTNGQAKYSESVKAAAVYFACKWVIAAVFKTAGDYRACKSYWHAADLRTDARLGYAIGDHFRKELRAVLDAKDVKLIEAIDYATEIAER